MSALRHIALFAEACAVVALLFVVACILGEWAPRQIAEAAIAVVACVGTASYCVARELFTPPDTDDER